MAPTDSSVKMRLMGTQREQMKGVLPWLVRWACHAGTKDFYPVVAVLANPVQNIFFLTVHFISSFVPIGHQTGQAVVLGHLSLGMCFCC